MGEQQESKPAKRKVIAGLPLVRERAAGIDLGSERHWVCGPSIDGSEREVADFGATTPELLRMSHWLKERRVESIAMESTGVYWIAPHEVLEGAGFEILLVDTRQLARVPGRDKKSDPSDCEWIQRLHSCGLLRGSFRPAEQVCMLRTLVRDKANLVSALGDCVRRMQKSLDQMNVRVHRAVSDLDGVTGMAILKAIANGERDPQKLARLRDPRCRKTEQEIAEQLTGHWREDHLFSLKQGLKLYEGIEQLISEYGEEIRKQLAAMHVETGPRTPAPPLADKQKAKGMRKLGQEQMRQALYAMSGVDLTTIQAIGVETAQVILSEYGPDLSRFGTEKEFASHITLVPRKPTSGGKPLRKKKRSSASTRVAAALRMAALSVRNSSTALGAYYRKLARRKSGDVAVFATARRLAVLIYRLLRWGQPYVDEGAEAFENRYRQNRLRSIQDAASQFGYSLTPNAVQG